MRGINLNTILVIVSMLGALYVYMEGNSTQSAVIAKTVETLRDDVDNLELSLETVPSTLVRLEEQIKFMREDIAELKIRN